MESNKYLLFKVNGEIYIQEIELLKKFEFFKKAIDNENNFKTEDINIEFEIDKSLVCIAFQIHNMRYGTFGFEQSREIYDFLKYLMDNNLDSTVEEIIFHYKPCCDFDNKENDDYRKIIELDKDNYRDIRQMFITKYIHSINKKIMITPFNFEVDKYKCYNYDNESIKIDKKYEGCKENTFLKICQEYFDHFCIRLHTIKLYQDSILKQRYNHKGKIENHYYRVNNLIIIINDKKFVETNVLKYFTDTGKQYKSFDVVQSFNIARSFNEYIIHNT